MKKKNGVVAGIAPRTTRAKDGAAGTEQTTDDEVRRSSSLARVQRYCFSFPPSTPNQPSSVLAPRSCQALLVHIYFDDSGTRISHEDVAFGRVIPLRLIHY